MADPSNDYTMINISSLLGTTGFHFILGLISQNQNVWSCPLFFFQCIYILTLYLYIFNVHTLIISSSPFSVFFVVINRTPHHTRRNDIILNHFVVRWLIAYILYTLSLLNTQTLKNKGWFRFEWSHLLSSFPSSITICTTTFEYSWHLGTPVHSFFFVFQTEPKKRLIIVRWRWWSSAFYMNILFY